MDDELFVAFVELGGSPVFPDQLMQIDVHVLENQVDVLVVAGRDHSLQRYYVRMLQLPQEHYLAVCTLRVCGVGKRVEVFLQRLHPLAPALHNFPNMTVCAAADLLARLIELQDVRLYLFSHTQIINIIIITDYA